MFNKLKNWRRSATRYDKTKESYLGFVSLVSTLQWIPFVNDNLERLHFKMVHIQRRQRNWRIHCV